MAAPADTAGTADTAVLVVDQEPELRGRMAEALAAAGHRVQVADDGLHAIVCLTQSDFDVVVTDVELPGAGGVEVLRRARVTSPGT